MMNIESFRITRTGLISIILIAALFRMSAAQGNCEAEKTQGRMQAELNHSSSDWFWGGMGIGMLTFCMGGPFVIGAAANTNIHPDSIPGNTNSECFIEGYRKEVRKQNVESAAEGVKVGLGISVAVVLVTLVALLRKRTGRPLMVDG
ncbi:MAG: hypothetical protein ACLFQB_15890 [Chitinispirillaceae bacterium]